MQGRDTYSYFINGKDPHPPPITIVPKRINIKRYDPLIKEQNVLISSRFGARSKAPAKDPRISKSFLVRPALRQKGVKCSLKAPGGDPT